MILRTVSIGIWGDTYQQSRTLFDRRFVPHQFKYAQTVEKRRRRINMETEEFNEDVDIPSK